MEVINEMLMKSVFTIKDLSKVLDKQSQTIRKWERKGIISKCGHYADNGWRQYNRQEFADVLEEIINYPWERNTIYNIGKIQYLVNLLKA